MQARTTERCGFAGLPARIDAGRQPEIKRLLSRLEVRPITPDVRELSAATIARVRGADATRQGFAACLGKRPARRSPKR